MKKYWILGCALIAAGAIAIYHGATANHATTPSEIVLHDQPSANAPAQNPANTPDRFKDTSMLKPPAGAAVAIYEFEDLECPACARAYPIVHAAASQYKIPLVRHDYPWPFHVWSFDAAVTARYLQDKLSPQLADAFRGDVFASQSLIASKDDLARFTARWFQAHGQSLPFVMDASGACRLEVEADRALGDQLGLRSTPCIFVVTQTKWVQVVDLSQLDRTIDFVLAQA